MEGWCEDDREYVRRVGHMTLRRVLLGAHGMSLEVLQAIFITSKIRAHKLKSYRPILKFHYH
jgi:hypothetical protein